MSEATDDPAYRLFEARFAALRRNRRTESLLAVTIVCLLVLVSIADTEFYPLRIAAGLPKIGEYFGKLFSIVPQRGADPVPVLALAHLFGGVKECRSRECRRADRCQMARPG
jgi:phosphonate transport system permease protein